MRLGVYATGLMNNSRRITEGVEFAKSFLFSQYIVVRMILDSDLSVQTECRRIVLCETSVEAR